MRPFFDGCEVDEKEEHAVEVFNQVPGLVAIFVQGSWLLAICFGSNHHLHTTVLRMLNSLVGVIGLKIRQSFRYSFPNSA
jgi:hypothetical protein